MAVADLGTNKGVHVEKLHLLNSRGYETTEARQ
jgi:hypothetical protein